jgi:integrase
MVYLLTEHIEELLADLAGRESDAGLIAELCLATGARWGETEKLQVRQVRHGFVHYSRTKSSKNRSVPISKRLENRLKAALPFKSSYNTFRRSVEAIGLELPDGQLTHALRHTFASHYMMNGGGHFDPAARTGVFVAGHDSEVCSLQSWAYGGGGFAESVSEHFREKRACRNGRPKMKLDESWTDCIFCSFSAWNLQSLKTTKAT